MLDSIEQTRKKQLKDFSTQNRLLKCSIYTYSWIYFNTYIFVLKHLNLYLFVLCEFNDNLGSMIEFQIEIEIMFNYEGTPEIRTKKGFEGLYKLINESFRTNRVITVLFKLHYC